MKLYSEYRLKRAKEVKIKWSQEEHCFIINNKYKVRKIIKNNTWLCSCKWACDNKVPKYGECAHVLGLYRELDKKKYFEEISREK